MPSYINFQDYKPTFIGKPVKEISKMMESTAIQNQLVFDSASALDAMIGEVANTLNPADYEHIIRTKNDVNTVLDDIATSKDHRTANMKLRKATTNFVTDKGINAATTRNANYTKWRDEQNARFNENKIDKWQYDLSLNNARFDPTMADEHGYYNTDITRGYDDVERDGNTIGYQPANKFDFENFMKDYIANRPDATQQFPYTKNGVTVMPRAEFLKVDAEGLKTALLSNPDAAAYMRDMSLYSKKQNADGKFNTVEDIAKQIATTYAESKSYNRDITAYSIPTNTTNNDDEDDDNKSKIVELGSTSTPLSKISGNIDAITSRRNETFMERAFATRNEPKDEQFTVFNVFGTGDSSAREEARAKREEGIKEYGYDVESDSNIKAEINNISKAIVNFDLDDDTKSFEERGIALEAVNKFVKYFDRDDPMAIYQTPIPEVSIEGVNAKPGVETLNKYIFGGNTIGLLGTAAKPKGADVAGAYTKRYFYDTESEEVMDGNTFKKEVLDELESEARVSFTGRFNYKNPYSFKTGNKDFSSSYDLNINGKTYVMSGAKDDPFSEYTIPQSKRLGEIFSLRFAPSFENILIKREGDKELTANYNEATNKYEIRANNIVRMDNLDEEDVYNMMLQIANEN